MDFSFLLKGFIIGLSIAAQVGPLSILCIRRTLSDGRLAGLVSGMGVATADALYGSIGGFGLTFVSTFLVAQQFWLRLVGGLFLGYLGLKTLLATPADQPAQAQGRSLTGLYFSTFGLTLTNPLTILSFAAILAGLGLGNADGNYGSAAVLIAGIFAGSALWWLLLTSGVNALRSKITPDRLVWVNRAAGLTLIAFGLIALWSLKG